MVIELVIFDMDGVLFEGRNFWLELHRRYATEPEALGLAERYLRTDYAELVRITTEQLWRGKTAHPLLDLVRARRYQEGVEVVMAELHRRAVRTAIVSSGPLQLAQRAQRELGIDDVRANDVEIVDGLITGRVQINVPDTDKSEVALHVMGALGVPRGRTAAVGDSASDASVAMVVGLSIAYDSNSPELDQIATVHLAKGQLAQLIDVLGEPPVSGRP